MSTNVTGQRVAFLLAPGSSINEDLILNDSGIQNAITNSLGQVVQIVYQPYYSYPAGVKTQQEALILTFFVNPTVAANIVSGIPSLKSRVQASQPQIQDVVTWAEQVAFN